MNRQLLFIQGAGAGTHDEWDNKLVESLSRSLGPEYEIRYPRMPDEGNPVYSLWKATLERELASLDDGAILVGHSLGGTMLVSALAERSSEQEFGALFLLAAPFIGDGGWPSDDLELPGDLGVRLPMGLAVHLYQGLDDDTAPPSHAELYASAVPQVHVHLLPRRDHQLNNDLREVATAIEAIEVGV